jgi:hypothetical protein
MKERIEHGNNPREDYKLARTSDVHRSPTFAMPIRRAHEQAGAALRKDSLAIRSDEGRKDN